MTLLYLYLSIPTWKIIPKQRRKGRRRTHGVMQGARGQWWKRAYAAVDGGRVWQRRSDLSILPSGNT